MRKLVFWAGVAAAAVTSGAARSASPPDQTAFWRAYEAAPFVKTPDGRRLRMYCMGRGSPVVVFEGGLGGAGSSYRWVLPQIAEATRACVYDRAGYGASDEAKDARDLEAISRDLGVVVQAAGRGRPVVLVGHSFGGPITRYFAYRHPKAVAGMVLIDPSGDDQNRRFEKLEPGQTARRVAEEGAAKDRCIALLSKGPIAEGTAAYRDCIDAGPGQPWPPDGSPSELKARIAGERGLGYQRATLAEAKGFAWTDVDAAQAEKARRALGDIPLIVLTRGQTVTQPNSTPKMDQARTDTWRQMHWEAAQLSTNGRRLFVEGAGHTIQHDKPEAVIAAVTQVVAEVRARGR
jgi:pimeloyl-ACP methyl ester carboxylesterase